MFSFELVNGKHINIVGIKKMKNGHRITKRIFGILAALFLVYVISYPLLRLSHVLVARDYFIYHFDDKPGRVLANHHDIGRGSAFHDGQLQPDGIVEKIYGPLAFVELYVRGYGNYPKVWLADEGNCRQ